MQITVCIKSIVRQNQEIVRQTMVLDDNPGDTCSLIKAIVKSSVQSYNERSDNEIVKVLSLEEIEDAAVAGKVSFGVHYPKANRKKPDIDRAIEHAIQLFEDGIVCIFNGDRRLESLDDTFDPQQPFTFVRLTMLSGRMW